MAINKKARTVIYCCGEGFSRVVDSWSGSEMPKVGEDATIEIYPGCLWIVKMFNLIRSSSLDQVDTFFFKSDDERLFDCLCDHLGSSEKDWVEVERVQPVQG